MRFCTCQHHSLMLGCLPRLPVPSYKLQKYPTALIPAIETTDFGEGILFVLKPVFGTHSAEHIVAWQPRAAWKMIVHLYVAHVQFVSSTILDWYDIVRAHCSIHRWIDMIHDHPLLSTCHRVRAHLYRRYWLSMVFPMKIMKSLPPWYSKGQESPVLLRACASLKSVLMLQKTCCNICDPPPKKKSIII